MHNGRYYPYHPSFWSTEGWFWPGFVPWKLHLFVTTAPGPIWDCLPIGYEAVSKPGVPTGDCKRIEYEFDNIGVCLKSNLFVRLEKLAGLSGDLCEWQCRLFFEGVYLSTAIAHQQYEQRQVHLPFIQWIVPMMVSGYGDKVPLEFRPATYAEGGSPYP